MFGKKKKTGRRVAIVFSFFTSPTTRLSDDDASPPLSSPPNYILSNSQTRGVRSLKSVAAVPTGRSLSSGARTGFASGSSGE